jgi:hypothetical protein
MSVDAAELRMAFSCGWFQQMADESPVAALYERRSGRDAHGFFVDWSAAG